MSQSQKTKTESISLSFNSISFFVLAGNELGGGTEDDIVLVLVLGFQHQTAREGSGPSRWASEQRGIKCVGRRHEEG